jgi:hypothetical protein
MAGANPDGGETAREGTNGTLRPKLYGILLQGITNLAKSASTVQLRTIEQMASNLLPILHDVGQQEPRAMASSAPITSRRGWIGSAWLCVA